MSSGQSLYNAHFAQSPDLTTTMCLLFPFLNSQTPVWWGNLSNWTSKVSGFAFNSSDLAGQHQVWFCCYYRLCLLWILNVICFIMTVSIRSGMYCEQIVFLLWYIIVRQIVLLKGHCRLEKGCGYKLVGVVCAKEGLSKKTKVFGRHW